MNSKFQKYLPSKRFSIVMGSVLGGLLIIFLIFFIFTGKTSFSSNKEKGNLAIKSKTVNDLLRQDTDLDGIPDWEEALWGTDKNKKSTFDNIPDSTYITNRKKELNIEQGSITATENLTETEKFSREFFASFAALKEAGEVDGQTINNFSSALGLSVMNTEIKNVYSEQNVTYSKDDTSTSRKAYYNTIKSLFEKHKKDGIGNELGILSESLLASEQGRSMPESYGDLLLIGQAYQSFSKELMNTPLPKSLINYHLKIANSAHSTGASVLNMQKITNDPILSLSGLSQYQNYSNELVAVVAILEQALARE
ncbi:MAG TPA: hypothetical protein VFQ59_01145 [Candidatus Paceibacterota bacterium]|nr:hypothetical protein [Candidatus Paceibacterota bacterium]